MREKNCNYFESRGQDAVLKLRAIIKEMPDFVTDFFVGIESSTSPLTRLNYAYDLRLFFDYLKKDTPLFDGKKLKDFCVEDLNKIQSKHIERFISYLTRYEIDGKIFINNERGKARKLSTLKSFFKYFFNKDLINSNVASKVIMPKLHNKPIVKLEADEVSRLLYVAEEGVNLNNRQKAFHSHTKVRDVAILSLLLGTGIRVSECVGLNKDDVDFKTNGIKITRKGGNQEIVYFSDEVKNALVKYVEIRDKNPASKYENALFLSLQDKRINVRSVQLLVKKYAEITTPLKKITPHKLRSTYGTALYHETQDIYIVADVLGHKDVNTTKKHYAAVSEDLRKEAANKVKLRKD